jgi:DNA-binding NtrC family response regulator
VVITSYGSIEDAVQATKNGAFDYLTKPIVDEEIRVVVEKAARQQALLFENHTLRRQLDRRFGLDHLIGHDHRMLKVFDLVEAVADSKSTVLIVGESGTGKSVLARAIHHRSPRRDKAFVELSCGALPESLLESELFGHTKGSFTGAVTDKPGRFLAADGGTIFLDEINSASPAMQLKLLRVLQEKAFEPVGSTETKTVDARAILASNVELQSLVSAGQFRQDLFWRINVVAIRLPPLRDRKTDIPMLADAFLRRYCEEMGREIVGFTPAAIEALLRHDWPGNVRELENAIERAVVLCRRGQVDAADLPEHLLGIRTQPGVVGTSGGWMPTVPMALDEALREPEKQIILAALRRHDFNRQATSDELKINRTTLYKKMRAYGLDGPGVG